MMDILMRVMVILERVKNMENLNVAATGLFGIVLVFGVLNCILGYRLLRFWMMLGGFFVGAGLAASVVHGLGMEGRNTYLAAMGITGVILSVIAFLIYKAGIFILGAGIGWALSIYVIHPTSSAAFFLCILIGIGLGSLGVRYCKEVIIVATSLIGGVMAGLALAKIGGMSEIPYGVGMSVGFALLGMLLQFALNKDRYEDEEDEEEPEYKELKHNSDSMYSADAYEDEYEDELAEEYYEENYPVKRHEHARPEQQKRVVDFNLRENK